MKWSTLSVSDPVSDHDSDPVSDPLSSADPDDVVSEGGCGQRLYVQ